MSHAPSLRLADLSTRVGSMLAPSDWIVIDQSRIDAFAACTDDRQFIHVDPARAARETAFGGSVAHGFLLLSLIGGHPPADFPWPADLALALNYGLEKVRFLAPVRSGARVRLLTRILELREKEPGRWLLRQEKTLELEGSSQPAMVAESLALLVARSVPHTAGPRAPPYTGGMLPDPVARFRADYRAKQIPARYRGVVNLWITFGGGGLALLACILQLDAVTRPQWLSVPAALIYANLAEYFGHRFPMHRPFPGLKLVYRRHAGQHHRFFTQQAMALEGPRDLRAVLFPPLLVVFFFGGFALPAWLLLVHFASANVAWLMLSVGIAYFLNYEFLHLAYHQPPGHWMARVPGVAFLRRLHCHHHDPSTMASCNFNITYPLGDLIFGTLARPRDPAAAG